MALLTLSLHSFNGGMNRLAEPTSLGLGEYSLLINGRNRFGGIEPIKLPEQLPQLPEGKVQGLYAADTFLIVFVSGEAYVFNYNNEIPIFSKITDFQMSAEVDTLFAILVPASTVNFQRKAVSATDKSGGVTFDIELDSSPACVLVQDGENQPWIILGDGSARITKSYDDWVNTDEGREYVPIGKQMVFVGNKLYIIAKDPVTGKYNAILHSVTGRPLDFVINIDTAGDKAGDAYTVAHRMDFSEVTCVASVGLDNGGFYISTLKQSYFCIPDLNAPFLFNEPQFRNQPLFSTGALNQFCITDLLGDFAITDSSSIRSNNAILQTKNEGRNLPFSALVQPLLERIRQTVSASITFDNYALFAVDTIYGNAILVYDTILQKWTGIDLPQLESGAKIKQFAAVDTNTTKALFFITTDNKLYQAFDGETAECGFYVGEAKPDANSKELKPLMLELAFAEVQESGDINAKCLLDSKAELTLNDSVTQTSYSNTIPIAPPFGNEDKDKVRNLSFDFKSVQYGWKVGFWVTWDFRCKLAEAKITVDIREANNSMKQQARDYNKFQSLLT